MTNTTAAATLAADAIAAGVHTLDCRAGGGPQDEDGTDGCPVCEARARAYYAAEAAADRAANDAATNQAYGIGGFDHEAQADLAIHEGR